MRSAFQITAAVVTILLTSLGAFAQKGPLMTTMIVQGVLRDSTGAAIACPVTDSWTLGFAIKQGTNVIKATGPVSVSCDHTLAVQSGFFSYQITGISPTFNTLAQGSVAVEVSGTVSGQNLNVSLLPSTVPTSFIADHVNPENTTSAFGGIAAGQVVVLDASAKLPAVDGSNITIVSSSVLSGALPVLDGSALTGVVVASSNITGTINPATQIGSGTFPAGVSITGAQVTGNIAATQVTGILPAGVSVSGSSITGAINSSQLSGALPALDGSALTSIIAAASNMTGKINPATQVSSGTFPVGISIAGAQVTGPITSSQLSGALPALDGSALTGVAASSVGAANILSGIFPAGVSIPATQVLSGILPVGVSIGAAQVTSGTFPALNGSNLTGVVAAAVAAGNITGTINPATQIGAGALPATVSVTPSQISGSISLSQLQTTSAALPTNISVVPSQISGSISLSQLQTTSVALPTNISVVPSQISGPILLSQLQTTSVALPTNISVVPTQISSGIMPAGVSIMPNSISSGFSQIVLNIGSGPTTYSAPQTGSSVPNFTLTNGVKLLVQMPSTASAPNNANPTFAINGGSAINMASEDGTNLGANQLLPGSVYQIRYDLTSNKWLTSLNNPLLNASPAVISFPTAASNAITAATNYTVPASGNFSLYHGATVSFTTPAGTGTTNAANPTLQVGAGPSVVMQDANANAIAANYFTGGYQYKAVYDANANKLLINSAPTMIQCETATTAIAATGVQAVTCPGAAVTARVVCAPTYGTPTAANYWNWSAHVTAANTVTAIFVKVGVAANITKVRCTVFTP